MPDTQELLQKDDWSLSDIRRLISEQVSESLQLEYKGGDWIDCSSSSERRKTRRDLCKWVSGFANSEGGVLIIGAVENDENVIVDIDGVDTTQFTRPDCISWIEQVLLDGIYPSIGSYLKIFPLIDVNEDKSIVVIKVTQTKHGLHKDTGNNKYYYRSELQTKPMDEWMVRAMLSDRR